MPYQSRYTATIADLMGAGQRARMEAAARAQQAEAEARNVGAQAWGNFAQGLGGMANNVAGVVLETQRQNKLDAIAARRDAETAKTNELHRQILQTQLTDRETAQQTAQRARERDMVLDAALKKAMKKDPNTGLVTFDRGMLQETFANLGMMEQWPTYSTLIDQSDAAITGMKKARQEAVVALAKTVDQSGNNPVVFQNQVAMGLANGVFTPQDIAPIIQGVGANPTAAQIAPVTAKLLGRQPDYKEVDPTKNIVDMNDPTKVLVTGTPKPPQNEAELAALIAAGGPQAAAAQKTLDIMARQRRASATPPQGGHLWVMRDGKEVRIPESDYRQGDVSLKQPTEAEYRAAGWYPQMQDAAAIMDETEANITDRDIYQIKNIPHEGLLGYMNRKDLSENAKRYMRAVEQFTEARLRGASGATINEDEFARDLRLFAKQYKETDLLNKDRRKARDGEIRSMKRRAGRALSETSSGGGESGGEWITLPDGTEVRRKN